MALDDFFADRDRELGGPRRAMAKALTPEQQAKVGQQAQIQPIVDAVVDKIGIASSTLSATGQGGQFAIEIKNDVIEQIVRKVLSSATLTATATTICNGDNTTTTTTTVTISV